MRVLIAGSGWLGTALCAALRARGDRVLAVRRTAAFPPIDGLETLVADLAEPGIVRHLPADLDAVIVCVSTGGEAGAARRTYVEVNRNLLEAASALPVASYVYTSSTGVFGQDDGAELDERAQPVPADASGEVLLEAEALVRAAATERLGTKVVRLSGLYGPWRAWPLTGVRAGTFALGPDEDRYINWCHRDDAVQAVVTALDRGRAGAVYHATDAHPARKGEVVRWIADRLGIDPPRRADAPQGRRARTNRRISGASTRAELGLTLAYPSYREGLADLLSAAEAC